MVPKSVKKSFVCGDCRFFAKNNEEFGYCLNSNSRVYQRKVSYNYFCAGIKEFSCYGQSILFSVKKEISSFKLHKVYSFCGDCKTKCVNYSIFEKLCQKYSFKSHEGLIEFGCKDKGRSSDFDKCRDCPEKCEINLAAVLAKGLLHGKVGSGNIYEEFLKGELI